MSDITYFNNNTRNKSFEINEHSGLYIIETKIGSNLNSSFIQLV